MGKRFNITGVCTPDRDYMVDIKDRLETIRNMIDRGDYFTISRARQYGKTTTFRALEQYLAGDYLVVGIDFQLFSQDVFADENKFAVSFITYFLSVIKRLEKKRVILFSEETKECLKELTCLVGQSSLSLFTLFDSLSDFCSSMALPVVLLIDEVDSATDNQVFLDFLAQLRGYYLRRDMVTTFQSVILAGVYDIRNLKRKLRPEDESRTNSPWNIAVDFNVDMNFSVDGIAGMLAEYESDKRTGMNIDELAELLYQETGGYPFLVCRICKKLDEELVGSEGIETLSDAWTRKGFLMAERELLSERNTLFDSLWHQVEEYPRLREKLMDILFTGSDYPYNIYLPEIEIGVLLGLLKKNQHNNVVIANRIFETWLYNLFLSTEDMESLEIYQNSMMEKSSYIIQGHLNMRLILERFVLHFTDLYCERDQKFVEEQGRKLFLLYLRPILNGTGNYYIEAQTRDKKRTDVIIDYRGEQFIIEMKIWHGQEYHEKGEKQLSEYLDSYHLKKGYMISFCFNKKKEVGVKEVLIGDKVLVEALV